jgi:hypothetical protein
VLMARQVAELSQDLVRLQSIGVGIVLLVVLKTSVTLPLECLGAPAFCGQSPALATVGTERSWHCLVPRKGRITLVVLTCYEATEMGYLPALAFVAGPFTAALWHWSVSWSDFRPMWDKMMRSGVSGHDGDEERRTFCFRRWHSTHDVACLTARRVGDWASEADGSVDAFEGTTVTPAGSILVVVIMD